MFTPHDPAKPTRYAIATGFLSFGIVAFVAPDFIQALMVRPEFHSGFPIVSLAIAALGAHAIAAGIFAAIRNFKSWTFLGFGTAMLPIFVMDYWLYAIAGAFNPMILLHAGGMLVMLALCVRGFRVMQSHEQALELV